MELQASRVTRSRTAVSCRSAGKAYRSHSGLMRGVQRRVSPPQRVEGIVPKSLGLAGVRGRRHPTVGPPDREGRE